ncbi:MAG TPA: SRPBCC family protein [Actinomycetota bacterium]
MGEHDVREITITKMLDAPVDLVFRAWTEAEHLARWWGPEGFTVPSAECDAREGGALRIVMRAPDGQDFPMTGTFREVDPPRRLVIASEALGDGGERLLEAVTTVSFVDHDGKCELTVHERGVALTPEAVAMLAGMELGMVQSLRKLDDLLTGAIDRQMALTRMLPAPVERVFEAWTAPEHLERWWGPDGFTTTTQEIDIRPGGVWRFTMHGPDGVEYPNVIAFEEIVPNERLVYLHTSPDDEDPSFRTTVTFDGFAGMTVLTMKGVFDRPEDLALVIEKYDALQGGNQHLDRMVAYVTEG